MSESTARSKKNQPPPLDPALQSKLVAKFGAKIMKRGFTALPRLVQDYFRYVPGNTYLKEVVNIETGEVSLVERISYMTPTEYALMTAIWSYWWTDHSNPWPSVESLCKQIRKSERQVRRYLQRLRDKGFMISLEQFNGEGKQISNRYDFTPFLKRLLAYLDALELREKHVQDTSRGDTFDGERMSEEAGRGCQNDQAKQIEEETDNSKKEEESNSSGSAASSKGRGLSPSPTCNQPPLAAIRSTEEGTNVSQDIESDRTSNRTQTAEELGAAARAKEAREVEGDDTGVQFETRQEQSAAAVGIPREHLESLGQGTRKRPDVPFFIEACVGQVSQQLNDAHPSSSITQTNNLFTFYSAQFEDFGEEQLRKHLYTALRLANMLSDAEVAVRHNGRANKMPAFFGGFKASLRREYGVEPLKGGVRQTETQAPSPAVPETAAPAAPLFTSEEEPISDEQEAWPEEPTQFVRVSRRPARTPEQKDARERYAKQVRNGLRQLGAHGSWEMMIDREHFCGCPLVDKDWKCVHCHPDYRWSEEARALIDSILEH